MRSITEAMQSHPQKCNSVLAMAPDGLQRYCLAEHSTLSAQTSDLHLEGMELSSQVAPRFHSHSPGPCSPIPPPAPCPLLTPSSPDRLSCWYQCLNVQAHIMMISQMQCYPNEQEGN